MAERQAEMTFPRTSLGKRLAPRGKRSVSEVQVEPHMVQRAPKPSQLVLKLQKGFLTSPKQNNVFKQQ